MKARVFKVYCSSGETAYRGDFSEFPEPHRTRLIEAVDQWGDVMVGWGVNELIYSLTRWHDEKGHDGKNEKIARLIMCVGSINRITAEERD
ncbi:MAG: hypothetical protein OXF42_04415 [Candidatus Dadabacteria bacterium]|nr:hypothetical protein [Candidatus Dadabacteria bacterium]